MTHQDITHLTQAIMDLKGQIERMSERQDEMLEDVKKLKKQFIILILVFMLVYALLSSGKNRNQKSNG